MKSLFKAIWALIKMGIVVIFTLFMLIGLIAFAKWWVGAVL